MIKFSDICDAAKRLENELFVTPTLTATRLSARLGCDIYLKMESLHRTGSFKERGALNKILSLSDEQTKHGLIAMSAGNHAQGVAYHAARHKIKTTIVMPETTPLTKVQRTKSYGASVVQYGLHLAESAAKAEEICKQTGGAFIHPYDDPHIIAGQGTIGIELLNQVPDLDIIIAPIGGGGLISGIALAAKHINPKIKIVGVQTELYPAMRQVLDGAPIKVGGASLAEGITVKKPGKITRKIVKEHVSDIALVSEDLIEQAVYHYASLQKIIVEGAGAAAYAAILKNPKKFKGKKVGVIVSGSNIDSRVLASILMRGLARDGQLIRLRIEMNDQPGSLASVASIIGQAGGNIVEVHHQRLMNNVPVKQTDIDIVVDTRDAAHVNEIIKALKKGGFAAELMLVES